MKSVIVAAVLLVACGREREPARDVDLSLIVVRDTANLQTKPVGGAPHPAEIIVAYKLGEEDSLWGEGQAVDASYVLVDAENTSNKDLDVSLAGQLTGADKTAPLRVESLWIPAGQRRTFVLLDKALAPAPWATGVKVVVAGAKLAKYPPPIAITDQTVFPDGDRVVAAARVTSTVKKRGAFMVLAAFHDAHDKPIARGSSLVRLAGGEQQTVRFVGPPGSKTATIFSGQSQF